MQDRATRTAPLTILGHADRHPTFLILLDAHSAPRLLNLLNLLLVQDQFPAAESLGLDDFPVRVAMATLVQLPLEVPNFGPNFGSRARPRSSPFGPYKGQWPHRYFFRVLLSVYIHNVRGVGCVRCESCS